MKVWMFTVVIGLGAWGMLRDCHIPINDGFGWDGYMYGHVALEPETIFGLPRNRVQRCLPSLLVHLGVRATGLPRSPQSVIHSFSVLNFTLIVASLIIWLRIVSKLKLGRPAAVFGFCGLFLSFSLATMSYYYPVLTDTAAAFLGVLSVWLYLCDRPWWLLGVAAVSGFVWPSFMYLVAPLVVFRIERRAVEPVRRWWRIPMAALAAVLVTLGGAVALGTVEWGRPIESVLPLTFVLLGGYVFWGSLELLTASAGIWSSSLVQLRQGGAAFRVAALTALWAVHYLGVTAFFPVPSESWQTPGQLLIFVLKTSVIVPAGSIVGHTAYLGILFLVVVALWSRICRAAAALGPGAWLFLGVCFAFSVNAESRHSNAHWPMVVMLACCVLDDFDWPWQPVALFCALSALNSRAWVDLNVNFPELVFANLIVNMSPFWYVVQAVAFALVAAYLQTSWTLTGFRRESYPSPPG